MCQTQVGNHRGILVLLELCFGFVQVSGTVNEIVAGRQEHLKHFQDRFVIIDQQNPMSHGFPSASELTSVYRQAGKFSSVTILVPRDFFRTTASQLVVNIL